MEKWFKKLLVCSCVIMALLCAFAFAEEAPETPVEDVPAVEDETPETAEEETIITIVPELSVVYVTPQSEEYQVITVEQRQANVQVRNGGAFLITAACRDARSLRWAMDYDTMSKLHRFPNAQGMALLGFTLYQWSEEDNIYLRITDAIDFMDPTSGQVPLYGLEPGAYILCLDAVGAVDGLPTDDGLIRATTGWVNYYFEVVE